jgi:hypothetical protein
VIPWGAKLKIPPGVGVNIGATLVRAPPSVESLNVRALGHTVEIERAWAREWTTGLSEGMTRGESNAESKHRAAHRDFLTNSHGTFPSQ